MNVVYFCNESSLVGHTFSLSRPSRLCMSAEGCPDKNTDDLQKMIVVSSAS